MTSSGARVLARRAELERLKQQLPRFENFLIVDDSETVTRTIQAVLHAWYGFEVDIVAARSAELGLQATQSVTPDLLFLSDLIEAGGAATDNIPYLRRGGFDGAIVVVTQDYNRRRCHALETLGATAVMQRDSLSTLDLGELLVRLSQRAAQGGQPEAT